MTMRLTHASTRPVWRPIMIGAHLPDRLEAAMAATLGIGLTAFFSAILTRYSSQIPDIIAPMGASAVLVFAVPASPLAQPWSAFGGNVISGLVAIVVCSLIPWPSLAIALSVGGAIVAMSLARCLHPPGGAVALLTALMAAKTPQHFYVALDPIALNTGLLVGSAWVYHRFISHHSWPHRASSVSTSVHGTGDASPGSRGSFRDEDIEAAVADLHESFDITRDDLVQLFRQVTWRAFTRTHGVLLARDIMSKDIISCDPTQTLHTVAEKALAQRLRIIPVVNRIGIVVGVLETPELALVSGHPDALVGSVMRPALTATPDSEAFALLPALSEGRWHGAVIIDTDRRLVGLITQTDLLAASVQSGIVASEAKP